MEVLPLIGSVNVLELEIKQDYTSPGTQKYVVSFLFFQNGLSAPLSA